jgi:hypothetical protein
MSILDLMNDAFDAFDRTVACHQTWRGHEASMPSAYGALLTFFETTEPLQRFIEQSGFATLYGLARSARKDGVDLQKLQDVVAMTFDEMLGYADHLEALPVAPNEPDILSEICNHLVCMQRSLTQAGFGTYAAALKKHVLLEMEVEEWKTFDAAVSLLSEGLLPPTNFAISGDHMEQRIINLVDEAIAMHERLTADYLRAGVPEAVASYLTSVFRMREKLASGGFRTLRDYVDHQHAAGLKKCAAAADPRPAQLTPPIPPVPIPPVPMAPRPLSAAPPLAPPKAPAAARLPQPLPSSSPQRATLVVLTAPLTKASAQDDALIAQWESLSKPLPLVEGPSPDSLEAALTEEFPWLGEVISSIVGDIRLRRQPDMPWLKWRPTLLVGPAGSGKSRFAHRLAELAGTGWHEVLGAGSRDNRSLQGNARGWNNTTPSVVLHTIKRCGVANPVMLVDEIDKAGSSPNGDICQTLLTFLEPTNARAWPDECLMVPCDLSAVNWLMCANDTAPLRGPLLTRLRVLPAPLPTVEHFDAIMTSIRRDLAKDLGVSINELPDLGRDATAALKNGFRRGISLRRIRAAVEGAVAVSRPLGQAMH